MTAVEVPTEPRSPADLAAVLAGLRGEMCAAERRSGVEGLGVDPAHRDGARNLVHYLAFRRHDERGLQQGLARLGLSSLGRSEGHILASVDQVLSLLASLDPALAAPAARSEGGDAALDAASAIDQAQERLALNTARALGPVPAGRNTRIMVTMPSEAATKPEVVGGLVERGMDCARINCAHDDEKAWEAMARNVRVAAGDAGRECRVLMDLPGPKLRTGFAAGAPPLVLKVGDRVVLTADPEPGGPGPGGPQPLPRVGCSVPEVLEHLSPGERVFFDDGKIGAQAVAIGGGEAELEVTAAAASGSRLRAEKGINVPDTDLHLSALTDEDLAILPFVASHADLVGMSFVQRPRDVHRLQDELRRLGAVRVGVVLKIETARAFTRLPGLILAAMANPVAAVMIARGDLAVECGWERLAEVQEEILWLAEAAHLPVIWATQVLDRMARKGLPSRAEITDAAMSGRSECVMLNKGPHIGEAVTTLDDILRRMSAHQEKKASLLRGLRAWSAETESGW